ncbi:MAG: carbohydrate kinase family protein [Acidobacteriia bacterium]|nr:carbohydrate kinase family protein [Terriglobia bacterium]
MKKIHCVGVLVVDLLCGPIERYPQPRTQTQVTTKWVRMLPGGGAANVPSAVARMGLQVSSFSKVGDDLNGEFIRRELCKLNVNTDGIHVSPRDATPFTFVGVHADGERTFIHTPGANVTFVLDDLDLDRVLATDFLLYHDLWVLPGLDGKPGATLLAEAQRRGVVTFLDEGFGYGPQRESLEAMLPYCDYAIPSFDDLQIIYPGTSAEEMADHLLKLGARAAILKMGRNGCLVARGNDRTLVPCLPAKVVDTTGAGDCWDAGFMAGLASSEDILTAARIGNACAAFGIEAVGGSTGVPNYSAVRERAATLSA